MERLAQIWNRLFHKPVKEPLLRLEGTDGVVRYYNLDKNQISRLAYSKVVGLVDDKKSVCISLTKLNIQKNRNVGFMLDTAIRPVTYRSYNIWAIYSTAFWYAIECNQTFFAFDIREVGEKMQIAIDSNPETIEMVCLHRQEWMNGFVKKMNESNFVIDIPQSIIAGMYKEE